MIIYSKVKPNYILHGVHKIDSLELQEDLRIDLVKETNLLQISAIRVREERRFQPHYHLEKSVHSRIKHAQESWVVIRGSVKAYFFDLDQSLVATAVLRAGDISFSLHGGHGYETLTSETLVYEFKTGPYLGASLDKSLIEFSWP